MATYNFSSLIGQTITGFNVDADTLAILNTGTEVTLTQSGSNLVATTAAGSVTLAGINIAQLTPTNLTVNGGQALVGDSTSATAVDVAGNTLNGGSGNNLIYGLGGGDTITVLNGNNLIFGGATAVDSTDGGDTLSIGSGTNTIYGNGGNDVITYSTATATGKTSTTYLGAGEDSITTGASAGTHVIFGNGGADTINAGTSTGDNTIYGGSGLVDTTDGADTITTGVGGSVVYANTGADNVTLGANIAGKTQTIYLGGDNDTLTSGASVGNAVIYGGAGTDNISVANFTVTSDYTIYGGASIFDSTDGADTIVGATLGGNSSIYGNGGADNITAIAAAGKTAQVFAGAGDDVVAITTLAPSGTPGTYIIAGGAGNDTLRFNFGAQVADVVVSDFESTDVAQVTLSAGDAADLQVSGNASSVTIFTGGNTTYAPLTEERITLTTTANLTATNFVLSDGSKLLTNFSTTATTLTGGGALDDHFVSGDAADTIVGSAGNDRVTAGAGNDTIQYTAALATAFNGTTETINGGSGTDTLEISDLAAVTMTTLNDWAGLAGIEVFKVSNFTGHSVEAGAEFIAAGFTTVNANALTGTTAITIDGSASGAAFTVDGGSATTTGAFTVTTGTGNDVIGTGAGNDIINLNATGGNDSVASGAGDDNINISAATFTTSDTLAGGANGVAGDTITLTTASTGGSAIVNTNFTNVTGIENLVLANGGGATQTITLGTAAGTAGLVLVNGLTNVTGGGNTLTVDASAMTTGIAIRGGDQADTITGGSGNDTLSGGQGIDVLVGGAGVDHYAFATATNGVDVIVNTNFVVGASGDIFNFDYNNFTTFTGLVTEGITNTATIAGFGGAAGATTGALVLTTNAVGNAAAVDTALNATDLDTATFGTRVVVWEIDANTVGIGTFLNGDNGAGTANDITTTQIGQITGFANQAAVDTFTAGLTASNFDFI